MTIDLPNDTTFVLDVPRDVLDDLHQRLARTRFPGVVADDWPRGTAPIPLRKLVEHWSTGYDWRAAEARINALDHQRTTVDRVGLHHLRAGKRRDARRCCSCTAGPTRSSGSRI